MGMALQRGMDDDQPLWPTPMQRLAGDDELRRRAHSDVVAVGSMVCPDCDAPVSPGRPLRPAEVVACPFCDRSGPVREFLQLGEPTRPARVVVRVRSGDLRIA
jgi:hypothetical protein